MMIRITCIESIAGTVNIMISQAFPFSADAHGLKCTVKVRARKFLEKWWIKAVNSSSLENEKRSQLMGPGIIK